MPVYFFAPSQPARAPAGNGSRLTPGQALIIWPGS